MVSRDIKEEEGPTLAAAPASLTTHRQRYERVRVLSAEEEMPARRSIAESLEAPKASLDALSQRWAELDDLDDGDEEVRS